MTIDRMKLSRAILKFIASLDAMKVAEGLTRDEVLQAIAAVLASQPDREVFKQAFAEIEAEMHAKVRAN